ncbi:DUF6884 domain-containing protein [Fervidibacillus albus]|uniref:GIY-YIG nuclease family protein n=1 Tax=Fervidibacillus albus TaxID=2980026 RepID=A0A9E8RVI4_9BACI|nr:DUF6884 domain-containing protein [Fervidibacillus albus]WAA08973.1 hypothetical protein OE104_10200 [Fervidibacillus albus]
MKIALIPCTSRKIDSYPAVDGYSEIRSFQLAYTYAKLVADQIFVFTPKYSCIQEDCKGEMENGSIHIQNDYDRVVWWNKDLVQLREYCDFKRDEFILLSEEGYYGNLIPNLSKFWIPFKGKRKEQWVQELEKMIKLEQESDQAIVLHMIFNEIPRLDWTMIKQIPYQNGIYIMFEKGEDFHGMDRIVRIGTHRGPNRLLKRLRNHFVRERSRGSIFRKNIGRVFLEIDSKRSLQEQEKDSQKSASESKYANFTREKFTTELEAKISRYLRNNITFVCFPVDEKSDRLRLEEGIIASLNKYPTFGPSKNWFGLNSPISAIAKSGLWNKQGLQGKPLSDEELDRVKWLARFGNHY